MSKQTSGVYRRPGPMRQSAVHQAVKLNLDLLPVHDREPVLRALSYDPNRRFPSNTAFVEALEKAGREQPSHDLYHTLLGVIPYALLIGETARTEPDLPSVQKLIADLVAPPEPLPVAGRPNARYTIRADGSWEYRLPVQLAFAGVAGLKVEGFRQHWNARMVHQEEGIYRLLIDVPEQRSFWQRYLKAPRRVEVEVRLGTTPASGGLTEALVRVGFASDDRGEAERILAGMAPQLFDSARIYFQAPPEQRSKERFPLTLPLRIYPVLQDLEVGEVLEGICRNVSSGGIRFHTGKRPESSYVYLHLYTAAATLGYAMLARVMHIQETPDGVEIGAAWVDGRPG